MANEIDDLAPQVMPQGPNIGAIIQNQLAPIQALLNRPAPNIPMGQPIVPEEAFKAAIARALGSEPPPLSGDQQSSVLGRIGAALMQPRQQGQSVAGNIGQAVSGGSQMADAMRQQNQATAMKQSELASTLETQQLNRRNAEMNMQILSAKFPVEFAEIQQRLRKATLEGNAAEVEAIKSELMKADGAKRIVESMNTSQKKAEADVANVKAQTGQHDAQSEYLLQQARVLVPAHAKAYEGLNKPDAFRVIDKDTGLVAVMTPNGGFETFKITPGVSDPKAAYAQAEKELNAKAKQDHMAQGGWGWTAPSASVQDIQKRAAEIMRGGVQSMGMMGGSKPGTTPAKPGTPAAGEVPTGAKVTSGNKAWDTALAKTSPYDEKFAAAEQKYELPTGILKRLAITEAGPSLNPKAVNPNDPGGGSHGLLQIQKVNFGAGQDPYDVDTNIDTGAKLFKSYLDKANGDVAKAVEMYKGASSDEGKKKISAQRDFIAGGGMPKEQTVAAAPAKAGGDIALTRTSDGKVVRAGEPKGSQIVATPEANQPIAPAASDSPQGTALDSARATLTAAKNKLMQFGQIQRAQNPAAYEQARAAYAAAINAVRAAEAAWSASVGGDQGAARMQPRLK